MNKKVKSDKTTKLTQQESVPFDPGYAPFVLTFSTTYFYIENEVKKFKNASQRKMKYKSFESPLHSVCDNLISFYFSGMLYGAYLNNKYKEHPKPLSGNDFLGLDIDVCKKSDVAIEVQTLEKFIKGNSKNPFASKQINQNFSKIIDDYIEFLEINNYFVTTRTTADIKIPQNLSYINNFSEEDLNTLYNTLMDTIHDKKIENILKSEYFQKIN